MSLSHVAFVEIGQSTSAYFAQIYKDLRAKGRPLPTNDMWIASTAKEYDLAVFTYDSHFQHINNLSLIQICLTYDML